LRLFLLVFSDETEKELHLDTALGILLVRIIPFEVGFLIFSAKMGNNATR
jgi:hypothetical protein